MLDPVRGEGHRSVALFGVVDNDEVFAFEIAAFAAQWPAPLFVGRSVMVPSLGRSGKPGLPMGVLERRRPLLPASADKADDVAHLLHGLLRDHARPLCAIAKNGTDFIGCVEIAAHFGGERRDFGHGNLGKRRLEGTESLATEFFERLLDRNAGQGCVDLDEVVASARPSSPLAQTAAARIGRRLLDLLGDGVASSVKRMRDISAGSDFDIFLVPSFSDITRMAGPEIIGSVMGKKASP